MTSFNRYFLISSLSLLIDLSFFLVFYSSGLNIFQSAIFARIISSVFNFSFNKYYVFKSSSRSPLPFEIISYFFLAFSTSLISASIINFMGLISIFFAGSGKFLMDCFLFVLNYFLQKKIIFNYKSS